MLSAQPGWTRMPWSRVELLLSSPGFPQSKHDQVQKKLESVEKQLEEAQQLVQLREMKISGSGGGRDGSWGRCVLWASSLTRGASMATPAGQQSLSQWAEACPHAPGSSAPPAPGPRPQRVLGTLSFRTACLAGAGSDGLIARGSGSCTGLGVQAGILPEGSAGACWLCPALPAAPSVSDARFGG